jgi:hypothetical protein
MRLGFPPNDFWAWIQNFNDRNLYLYHGKDDSSSGAISVQELWKFGAGSDKGKAGTVAFGRSKNGVILSEKKLKIN